MSEISDKFFVDEITNLRENESLLKKQINELRSKVNVVNVRLQSEYDKPNKILTVYLKTGKDSICLKYDVDASKEKLTCSTRYTYSDSIDFNVLVSLGNLVCPDDIRDLFDCIWREEIL